MKTQACRNAGLKVLFGWWCRTDTFVVAPTRSPSAPAVSAAENLALPNALYLYYQNQTVLLFPSLVGRGFEMAPKRRDAGKPLALPLHAAAWLPLRIARRNSAVEAVGSRPGDFEFGSVGSIPTLPVFQTKNLSDYAAAC